MHVAQQCTAVLKRSLFKFNRNKHNRSVKGSSESALGTWQGQTPRQASGCRATALSPPVRNSLRTFLHPFCNWPPGLSPQPLPLPANWKQTTLTSKRLLNYFLPKQSQNIKHVLKSCTIPWRNFMIWLLLRSMRLLLGWSSLESMPNNEAILLLAFPFNGDKTAHVSIFKLFSSGAIDMQKLKPWGQGWTSRAK